MNHNIDFPVSKTFREFFQETGQIPPDDPNIDFPVSRTFQNYFAGNPEPPPSSLALSDKALLKELRDLHKRIDTLITILYQHTQTKSKERKIQKKMEV